MSAAPFPIVGIGASAGGVEALEGFFSGLPDHPGIAVVIVTHLSPERESLLHEIVDRYTGLPVHIAADDARVEPNHVYVLPADSILGLENGRLRIRKPDRTRRERKPIDLFFSALATDRGEWSAGVVLSGGNSDGTLGIKAIKERGGLTLAQIADGHGPQHANMPDSAIATGLVDFAVPVDQMGARLVEFARSARLIDQIASNGRTDEGHGLDEARSEICAILRNQVGHDFSGYKTRTFLRRVQRRMQVTQLDSIEAYVERLRQDPQEVGALFRDLLINVTNFFRDADAFDTLAAEVVPQLFAGRGAEDTIRIWVPGCSTGEEVFSLAILMREHMAQLSVVPRVQIFATDIDERALGVARAARYPAALLDSVDSVRRERFFIADGGGYVVTKEVREMCIFSPHNLIRDPPFSRMDLISCRNLLIYFGSDVQNQVIPTFHYALRPEAYLFLGTSENVSQFNHLFVALEKQQRIFRRRSDAGPRPRLPLTLHAMRTEHLAELTPRRGLGAVALRQAVDGHVMERFAPPHVVVNRDGDVVFYSGRTGKYLEAAPGAPTRQLLTTARKGLRLDLRTLFREVVESGRPASREGVSIEDEDGRVQLLTLIIEPLSQPSNTAEPLYLVLFHDQGPVLSRDDALGRARLIQEGGAEQVERELRDTRERLQSMIEEYETALEELKSSNEELVSVNEELQSTNEELEASKEELVSLNEELHTVNAELSGKVDELDRANSDLQNLFDSTDIATVFLDDKLLIRSFTPAATQVFNILPSDRGRPITDLASRFSLPGFTEDIAAVLAKGEPVERTVGNRAGSAHYLVRLSPYRDGDQRTSGVVISFLDVTGLTQAEAHQRVLIAELQHRTRNLLAVVQSIAQQTLGKGGSLNAYLDRLAALGRVQGLISNAAGEHVDLAAIVRQELVALGTEDGRVSMDGPALNIPLAAAQTFALALHELGTNALKHGALRDEGGRLDVLWGIQQHADDGASLVLTWRESGVALPPSGPARRGFGRLLIEQALAHDLGARTELLFGTDGVSCSIEMPVAPSRPPDHPS